MNTQHPNTGNKNAENFVVKAGLRNNVNLAAESLARRQATLEFGVRKKVDYSDKGDHDWYLIGAFAMKCSKCNVIKDILFDSPYYLLDVEKHQWVEPLCTWKGRAAR
jgi:hypothetical protein